MIVSHLLVERLIDSKQGFDFFVRWKIPTESRFANNFTVTRDAYESKRICKVKLVIARNNLADELTKQTHNAVF